MHVCTRLVIGGAVENTVLSCEGQADRGHEVLLAYGPIYGPEGSMLERARSHGGIELAEIPHLTRDLAPVSDVRAYVELRRLIRRWRPDVVHTHLPKAGVLGRLAAWRERVPAIVHTLHGLAFHPYQPAWRNRLYVAAERFAARRCHRIPCVADAMARQSLAVGIGTPEQFVTVYSGMEVQRFLQPQWSRQEARAALGFTDQEVVIGTVARLADLKGHDDVLDALAGLMGERPELRLLWVGDGWLRERLEARIDEMGLGGRVHVTGIVPPEEVPRYLQAMDLLVHASYREGLPRAVTEALLSGTPVVAYDVDGVGEVCIDGETGRLVAAGDRKGLADAAGWVLEHPARAREMAMEGRSRFAGQFPGDVMVEALEDVYAGVLARA